MVKDLINYGASESIIRNDLSKGLKKRSKTEIKRWETTEGQLTTSYKTKNS